MINKDKYFQLEDLFDQLCVELGYCLYSEDRAKIVSSTPMSVGEFADKILLAEGVEPSYNKQSRKQVIQFLFNFVANNI